MAALLAMVMACPCRGIVVTNTGRAEGSLRSAIGEAASGSVVSFDASMDGQTISTGGAPLILDKDLVIDASALASGVTFDAEGESEVIFVASNHSVVLKGITITGGASDFGGGIHSRLSDLRLEDCVVTGNAARHDGGGIFADRGKLTLARCRITQNHSGSVGGGISYPGSQVILEASTVSHNEVDGQFGGGLGNRGASGPMVGSLTLTHSTVSHNTVNFRSSAGFAEGGGIFTGGTSLTLNDSTVAFNAVGKVGDDGAHGRGGGISHNGGGSLVIQRSTISGNATVSEKSSGLYVVGLGGTVTIGNSIVAGNPRANAGESSNLHIVGQPVFEGVNITEGDPKLAPLDWYGGPTQTMVPLTGSPALDAGPQAADLPDTDQRGFARLVGDAPDIGSVEGDPNRDWPILCRHDAANACVVDAILLPLGPPQRVPDGTRLLIPRFLATTIGIEYSPNLKPGTWIDLGNFGFEPEENGLEFIDPDPVRKRRSEGFYRAFLRRPR